jgi:predicted esterase
MPVTRVLFSVLAAATLMLAPRASVADGREHAADVGRSSPFSASKDDVVSTPKVKIAERNANEVSGIARDWCAPEFETLPSDVCLLEGAPDPHTAGGKNKRRTLVVFLHGAIAKNTTWSWNHQRMMVRLAKGHGVDIVFPKSPLTDVGYVWPGTLASQERTETDLIDGWMTAKRVLEERATRPYDEVFVMGFSSGAYFTSSLAMRGRLDVDGYATFAGGQGALGHAQSAPIERWSPVFVGVCADDAQTASHSRAFAGALSAAGIPRAVLEQHVGHGVSAAHFAGALAYLRRGKH